MIEFLKKKLETVIFRWLRNERSGKRFSHTRLGVWVGRAPSGEWEAHLCNYKCWFSYSLRYQSPIVLMSWREITLNQITTDKYLFIIRCQPFILLVISCSSQTNFSSEEFLSLTRLLTRNKKLPWKPLRSSIWQAALKTWLGEINCRQFLLWDLRDSETRSVFFASVGHFHFCNCWTQTLQDTHISANYHCLFGLLDPLILVLRRASANYLEPEIHYNNVMIS